MWIISEEGIILKSVGQLSIYKIHLRIAMCKFSATEEGSVAWNTELTYKVTWSWKQEEKPDLV